MAFACIIGNVQIPTLILVLCSGTDSTGVCVCNFRSIGSRRRQLTVRFDDSCSTYILADKETTVDSGSGICIPENAAIIELKLLANRMLRRRGLFINPLVCISANTINGVLVIDILRHLVIPFPYGQGRTPIGLGARL